MTPNRRTYDQSLRDQKSTDLDLRHVPLTFYDLVLMLAAASAGLAAWVGLFAYFFVLMGE